MGSVASSYTGQSVQLALASKRSGNTADVTRAWIIFSLLIDYHQGVCCADPLSTGRVGLTFRAVDRAKPR